MSYKNILSMSLNMSTNFSSASVDDIIAHVNNETGLR